MEKWKKHSRVIYQCKYHIVWCPKYRYRVLKGNLAKYLEAQIRLLCEWKEVEILELSIQEDHVHLILEIPPKLAILQFMGILKGKTAIKIFKKLSWFEKETLQGKPFLE